jgi:hypothetical protein
VEAIWRGERMTITDEQIRQLRYELVSEIARLASTPEAWTIPLDKAITEADWALSKDWGFDPADFFKDRRQAARMRCAEILNARKTTT